MPLLVSKFNHSSTRVQSKNKVLVLMATFNGQAYLKEQIDSVINQKNVDINILISDDMSTDDSLKIIESYARKNNRIMVLENKKRFGSAAPNFFHLIKKCDLKDYDYIAFSDQDDIWFKDKLQHGIDEMNEHNADGFSSDIFAYWPVNEKKILIKKSYKQKKYDYIFEGPGPGCSQIFTSKSFQAFKKFIETNYKFLETIDYHDWLIYTFYRHNKFKWHISSKPKMLYRQHQNNQIGVNSGLKAKFSRIKDIQNNWYKDQIIYNFNTVVREDFRNFIFLNKLIFKPFSLRRKLSHSVFVWLLIVTGVFKK